MAKSNWKELLDAAIGVPAAAAAGAAREVAAQKVNPSFAKVPVAKTAWYLDAGTMAVGLLGPLMASLTGERMWADATQGALYAGTAYLTQDLTHAGIARYGKSTAAATAPTKVLYAEAAPIEMPYEAPVDSAMPAASYGWGSDY